ncbi:uncharacterized protein LOC103731555 [Nannospalax galili]|uniref:uncharacterized protein LOC103731555 n=1 Tax=Nannospalax galili TaxID=1026970 RepID=UPI0004ED2115|nr:uncharacterized protein LOC103731555 [Nannospalax galili]
MELSPKSMDSKEKVKERRFGGLGRCRHFFWLGVAFDAVGVAVLFTGIFADLLFYDMLLYLGSIIIFISLLWWVSWYTGNIEVFPEDPVRRSSHRSSRRFSLAFGSVPNTFLRIRRQRRRRRPRVLRETDCPSPQEGQSVDCRAVESDKASAHPARPVFAANLPQHRTVQASKSLTVTACQPFAISTSRSQPVFSGTSHCYPPEPVTSQSHPQFFVSSDNHPQVAMSPGSQVPGDPQRRSKISVASQSYTLGQADSHSHFLVPVASESFPMVPMISQTYIQGSVASQNQLQHLPPASQTQPATVKSSGSHILATQVPVVPPEFAQIVHTQASLAQTSQSHSLAVQKVSKSSAEAFETVPAPSQKLTQEQPDRASSVSRAIHPATQAQQSDPSDHTPASGAVRKSHPF